MSVETLERLARIGYWGVGVVGWVYIVAVCHAVLKDRRGR